jgi:multidrug efflux pump subunit AcrB
LSGSPIKAPGFAGGYLLGTFMSLFYLPLFYVWMSGKGK